MKTDSEEVGDFVEAEAGAKPSTPPPQFPKRRRQTSPKCDKKRAKRLAAAEIIFEYVKQQGLLTEDDMKPFREVSRS